MEQVLLYTLGVVVFVTAIAVSIALHEIGHLVPAKLFGVKVTQYMVGFGKTLWSTRRGETEYGVKMLPLGGYVRMIGMFPPAANSDRARPETTSMFGQLIDDARHQGAQEVQPGEEGRAFYALSAPKKLAVMFGGPFVNLVLGAIILGSMLLIFGNPMKMEATPTLNVVNECVLKQSSERKTCEPGDPVSPAAKAGLRPGDRVVAINGTPAASWDSVREVIRTHAQKPLTLTIERDGQPQTVSVTPMLNEVPKVVDQEVVRDGEGKILTEEVGFLGVAPKYQRAEASVADVPGFVGHQVGAVAKVVLDLPSRMVGVAKAAFSSEKRDPEGPIGMVGVGRLTGEVASIEGISVGDKIFGMMNIIGGLNIALFVFNMIPLLPLDGGHIAGALFEGLRRTVARLRGKPDPGPVDTARALPLAYAVAVLLITMSVLLLYADIVKPVSLKG